ncbi:MAG: hypothetical protein PVJ39_03015 [Gammaproteobacteria bacterium]
MVTKFAKKDHENRKSDDESVNSGKFYDSKGNPNEISMFHASDNGILQRD